MFSGKESAGHTVSVPRLGRSLEEGNGNPFQYCLGNPMERGAWQATVYGVAKELDSALDTVKLPSKWLCLFTVSSVVHASSQGLTILPALMLSY